jgi:two-component system, NarL family, invasion response regulator UvrY
MRNGGLRVLMIDDSELAVEVQTTLLERHGFAVRACLEMAPVAAELEAFHPEVILLDAHLGDVTVEEAVDALRAQAPAIPVLLFSGMMDHELDALARRLGVAGFISKADPPETVIAKLRASDRG